MYKGYTGAGFVAISKTRNTALTIPVTVPEAGLYAVDFRCANGNGPVNTNNRCAIRILRRGPALLGTVVLLPARRGRMVELGLLKPRARAP